jgi:hypothetical protein
MHLYFIMGLFFSVCAFIGIKKFNTKTKQIFNYGDIIFLISILFMWPIVLLYLITLYIFNFSYITNCIKFIFID